MKNQVNSKLTVPVDARLEVRICPEMWERIKWVAARRESSYSWVVRYALFRLIKRIDPKRSICHIGNPRHGTSIDAGLNERAWARRSGASRVGAGAKHRHQLCLYGADELAIRYTAAYYGCTMTHLIRVALELHFERLYAAMLRSGTPEMTFFQRAFWFWLGIKIFRDAEFRSISLQSRPLLFQRYAKFHYFGRRYSYIKTNIGRNIRL